MPDFDSGGVLRAAALVLPKARQRRTAMSPRLGVFLPPRARDNGLRRSSGHGLDGCARVFQVGLPVPLTITLFFAAMEIVRPEEVT